MARPRIHTTEERFWAKVEKTDGCWNWTGSIHTQGYGVIKIDSKMKRAHRLSYELAIGRIPDGLLIDHICHNKGCVNPAHLRLATQKQNVENQQGGPRNSKSGIRGVRWYARSKKWEAYLCHNGKTKYLGRFATKEAAGIAAQAGRNKLFTHNDADRQHQAA